jgi:dipeptidyl aminopeptidase/acylaminoacyl peptidase
MARAPHARITRWLGTSLVGLLLAATPAWAQNWNAPVDYDAIIAAEGYLRPPPAIEQAVLAPRHLQVSLTNLNEPASSHFLNLRSQGMQRIADLGKPHHDLAGWLIDFGANRSRALTTTTTTGVELISWSNGRTVNVQVPANAKVTGARWSPDGTQVAYFVHSDTETHIHVADVRNGSARQVTPRAVLATHVTSFSWTTDGEHIVTVLVPANRGPAPVNGVSETPKVRVAQDGQNRLRTYFSLLESPHDMQLLEYYSTGQLARVNVRTRRAQEIGRPTMIQSLDASPDGRFFRVTQLRKPFSYIVPISNFAGVEEIWDENGRALTELSSRALREGISAPGGGGGGAQSGEAPRRALTWRPDGPGLVYLQREPAPARPAGQAGGAAQQAQAGGGQQAQGGQAQAARKDRVVHWLPPFTEESAQIVFENDNEIGSIRYSADGRTLFLSETVRNQSHVFAVSLDDPTQRWTITRSGTAQGGGQGAQAQQPAAEPPADDAPRGTLMSMRAPSGMNVVRTSPDGRYVYLSGTTRESSESTDDPDNPADDAAEAPRPFIDRFDYRSGELTRIYEGDPSYTESIQAVLDADVSQIVVSRQRSDMVPQSFHVNVATGQTRQLTQNPDYTPDALKGMQTRTLFATRADGLRVRVRVRLPAEFRDGDRLPAMFWFYPREFSSPEAYERTTRTGNNDNPSGPGRYPTVGAGSIQMLTMLGYAVVEPDAPIIGSEGRMNDNYVHDLRNNLAAVIDLLDSEGIIDRNRLGIGGHSYGGFSTGNAMVHTPFFKAGISGAANYNRTLTPLGFQSERRDLWAGRETYLEMSSFLYADRLTGALLMYHGMQDSNVGTHPVNSERMFHALNGLGKTTALYMYPYEAHGQSAMETRLDMWARWVAWLDKYVKYLGEPPRAIAEEVVTNGAGR